MTIKQLDNIYEQYFIDYCQINPLFAYQIGYYNNMTTFFNIYSND